MAECARAPCWQSAANEARTDRVAGACGRWRHRCRRARHAATVVVVAAAGVVVVVVVVLWSPESRGGRRDGAVNVSLINVTEPFRARARPCTVTLSSRLIEVRAMMLPTMTEPVPSTAELPICQKTLHSWAPLISETLLPDARGEARVGLEDEDRIGIVLRRRGSASR